MTEHTNERNESVTNSTSNDDRNTTASGEIEVVEPSDATDSKRLLRIGWILSTLPVLFLLFDGVGKAMMLTPSVDGTVELGYSEGLVVWLGIVLLVCTALYVIPRTAVLGAILLTGFLGGAVATQVRFEEPWFLFPVLLGVLLWGGLYLRDERLRTLVPLRATPDSA